MRRAACLALILLAGCAPGPRLHHPRAAVTTAVTPAGMAVTPHVSTGIGGVRLGVGPNGARVGTRFGPVSVGVGL